MNEKRCDRGGDLCGLLGCACHELGDAGRGNEPGDAGRAYELGDAGPAYGAREDAGQACDARGGLQYVGGCPIGSVALATEPTDPLGGEGRVRTAATERGGGGGGRENQEKIRAKSHLSTWVTVAGTVAYVVRGAAFGGLPPWISIGESQPLVKRPRR